MAAKSKGANESVKSSLPGFRAITSYLQKPKLDLGLHKGEGTGDTHSLTALNASLDSNAERYVLADQGKNPVIGQDHCESDSDVDLEAPILSEGSEWADEMIGEDNGGVGVVGDDNDHDVQDNTETELWTDIVSHKSRSKAAVQRECTQVDDFVIPAKESQQVG